MTGQTKQWRRIAPGVYVYGFTSCLIVKRDVPTRPWLIFVKEGVGGSCKTLSDAKTRAEGYVSALAKQNPSKAKKSTKPTKVKPFEVFNA